MACNDGLFASYVGAPEGSTLEVTIEGDPNEFIASGKLSLLGGAGNTTTRDLTHDDLVRGHVSHLSGNVRQTVYTVNVLFTVMQPASARIKASVITPAGSDLDTPYCHQASGSHGNRTTASIAASR